MNIKRTALNLIPAMICSPITLFVYNRPEHTRRTVEALKQNKLAKESNLIIFSDAPRSQAQAEKVCEVRAYIRQIDGFNSVTVIERETNFGLARSIIDGVTSVVNQHGRVIVLEDDLVTSPYFLQYMNDGLMVYEDNDDVASIHGYVYPIDSLPETFFMRGADCWGWATWKNKWAMFEPNGAKLLDELKRKKLTKRFDFNGTYGFTQMLVDQIAGNNDSWAIRWHASAFLKNKYTLYPGKSLVLNIGNDGSGEHSGVTDLFFSEIQMAPVKIVPIAVVESEKSFKAFEKFFKNMTGIVARVRRVLGRLFSKFKGIFLERI